MDDAHRGEVALSAGKPEEAVTHYTKALEQSPSAPTYYIKRSTAHQRLSKHNEALEDAEKAVVLATKRAKRELIAQAQLRRGIALFNLERYGDARFCFDLTKKYDDKEKSVGIWQSKVSTKLETLEPEDPKREIKIEEVPKVTLEEAAKAKAKAVNSPAPATSSPASTATTKTSQPQTTTQTPADKIRHDWYQNEENVYLSIMAKGVPKDQTQIDIQDQAVSISFPLVTGSTFDMSLDPLAAVIDPASSSSRILSTKIEIVLRKVKKGERWSALETDIDPSKTNGTTEHTATKSSTQPTTAPAYPTSSRSGPKNWDRIAESYTKPPEKSSSSKVKKKDKGKQREGTEGTEGPTGSSSSESESGEPDTKDDKEYIDEYEDGDPVNGFFKKLYAGASDETRRAMMKSYQESGGTALSTNWDEVKKERVKVTPPDGMQEKKWGE
ncbi:MAG: hypothetical protein M1828_000449 [Chrysothrix sp. TS-e1954]|nr:MAG: hypothetical protein M1828_000449 [Chrysothrix sp. TS-e1954]